jgi:hypothetical protein
MKSLLPPSLAIITVLLASVDYIPQPPNAGCPAGWMSVGGACQRMNRAAPDALSNPLGASCPPTSYSDGKNCIFLHQNKSR